MAFPSSLSAMYVHAQRSAKSSLSRIQRPLLAVIQAFTLGSAYAATWVVEGRVVGVSDGATITILDNAKTQHRIRLAGIYAPEKGQAFSEQSKQSLSALVYKQRVEAWCHKRDRYGREVCSVFVDLRDVGLQQIRQGMAWHYKDYQHEQTTQDRLVYRDEEEHAKAERIGLWHDEKPVPPWLWRRKRGQE